MRPLYTLLLTLAMPLALLRLLWRSRRLPAYRQRLGERFAVGVEALPEGAVWFHAVSVGEVIAAVPLVKATQAAHPDMPVLVTTTTPTGSERVRALLGDSVAHVYLPYDLPWLLARFLRRVQPRLLVILETELWPNLLAACRSRAVPVLLANARLSEKSARGYARFGGLTRGLLQALDTVAVQNADDGERFVRLGLPRERLDVVGSVKFDVTLDETQRVCAEALKAQWTEHGRRPVWIAASTHAGEEALVLQAHRRLLAQHPRLRLLLVPRHPDRFETVARLIQEQGFNMHRRSGGALAEAGVDVLLGDSLGELLMLYGTAELAFIGGSLVPVGGHNPLEAVVWGLPVLSGPHRHNFSDINNRLETAGALETVADAEALAKAVAALFGNAALRAQRGQAGLAVLAANRGAVARQQALISRCLAAGSR